MKMDVSKAREDIRRLGGDQIELEARASPDGRKQAKKEVGKGRTA